jgi:hypothetical protein
MTYLFLELFLSSQKEIANIKQKKKKTKTKKKTHLFLSLAYINPILVSVL